jgi:hypothetical protein
MTNPLVAAWRQAQAAGKRAEKAMNEMLETDCETCLRVRYHVGQTILAVENAVSRQLGFTAGEDITGKVPEGTLECMEMPTVKAADLVDYRNALRMSQEEFAAKFGVSVARLQELEMTSGDIGYAMKEFDLTSGVKFTPDDKVLVQIGTKKSQEPADAS